MDLILTFFHNTIMALFAVMEILLLLRALLSWFFGAENRFIDFVFAVTEPMIMPFRLLCDRFGWFQDIPIDVPFLMTVISISILETIVDFL